MMMAFGGKTGFELVPSYGITGPNLGPLLELIKQGYVEPFILRWALFTIS